MSLPFTVAHTSGPGATSARLQETASVPARSIESSATIRFKRNPPQMPESGGLLDAAGADASGADAHALVHAIDHSFHSSKIGIPAPPRHIIRVADVVAETRLLAANIAFHCHS